MEREGEGGRMRVKSVAFVPQNPNPQLTFKVEVSYMEIYCEKVRDLLCPKG